GVLPDVGNITIFTTGGSKDINDVSQWGHTNGSSPDKDDITNAYAAAYSSGGRLIVVAGADRFANNGSANVGVWVFQPDLRPLTNGPFGPGVHSVGDILVVVEFTGGGVITTERVFRWNGTTIELLVESTACGAPGQNPDVCARSNTGNAQLLWSYT